MREKGMYWEHVPNGSSGRGMQTSTGTGKLREGASSTQTAQSPLDPRTLNRGQETLKELLREKMSGEVGEVTEH